MNSLVYEKNLSLNLLKSTAGIITSENLIDQFENYKTNKKLSNDMHLRNTNDYKNIINKLNFLKCLGQRLNETLDLTDIILNTFFEFNNFMDAEILSVLIDKNNYSQLFIVSTSRFSKKSILSIKHLLLKEWKNKTTNNPLKDLKIRFICVKEDSDKTNDINISTISNMDEFSIGSLLLDNDNSEIGVINLHKIDAPFTKEQQKIFYEASKDISISLSNSLSHMRMVEFAYRDSLTGILNRRVFDEVIVNELKRADRNNTPLSLVSIDIDHFKNINDTHGHHAGDIVLCGIVNEISGCIRDTDVLARYGGDEFVLLLPETNKKQGLLLAEKIRNKINNYCAAFNGKEISVTVSIGIKSLSSDSSQSCALPSVGEILKKVDKALYSAKSSGRNTVCAA